MLRIAGLSGAELPVPADVAELLPNARALKQHLSQLIGAPRFRIRLLIGGIPLNDILPLNCYLHPPLKLPLDLQIVVLGGFQDTDAEQRAQLTLAAARGYVVTVEWFLQRPQDPNLKDEDGKWPLGEASIHGQLAVVNLLIESQADLHVANRDGAPSLHLAAEVGHLEIVRSLLQANANQNYADFDGLTALQVACSEGHADVVRLLLDFLASVDQVDIAGWAALHHACYEDHVLCASLLLAARANCALPNLEGQTPLHVAADEGNIDSVRLLLDAGSHDVPDVHGLSAVEYAHQQQHEEVVLLLMLQEGVTMDPVDDTGAAPSASHLEQHGEGSELVDGSGQLADVPSKPSEAQSQEAQHEL